jgi:hypothetical protein
MTCRDGRTTCLSPGCPAHWRPCRGGGATRLSGLPRDLTLVRYANLATLNAPATAGTLTGLNVWADSSGVVRQMRIGLEGTDGQTTVTVTFTDSGQPQSITAPAFS